MGRLTGNVIEMFIYSAACMIIVLAVVKMGGFLFLQILKKDRG